jgi:hypothetical protein
MEVQRMAKKKTNPNRILISQAEANRMVTEATNRAVSAAFEMMLYILIDKHDAPHEDVQQLARELEWLARSLNSNTPGHLTWGDVHRVLDEYHVRIRYTHDKTNQQEEIA